MGKLTPTSAERAAFSQSGQLAAIGSTDWFNLVGLHNLSLWGDFQGEVVLERSFDGGTTPMVCTALGQEVVFTKGPVTEVLEEPERGVLFRLNFRVRTAGTLNWRISR